MNEGLLFFKANFTILLFTLAIHHMSDDWLRSEKGWNTYTLERIELVSHKVAVF